MKEEINCGDHLPIIYLCMKHNFTALLPHCHQCVANSILQLHCPIATLSSMCGKWYSTTSLPYCHTVINVWQMVFYNFTALLPHCHQYVANGILQLHCPIATLSSMCGKWYSTTSLPYCHTVINVWQMVFYKFTALLPHIDDSVTIGQ